MARKQTELEKRLSQEMREFAALCFTMSEDESFEKLADRAGLSPSTLYRLYYGETRYPQLLTIQKLAYAVGLRLTLIGSSARISLIKAAA